MCVPIDFGGHLVGIVKLVVDGHTSAPALKSAQSVLELVVSGTCSELACSLFAEQVQLLEQRVNGLDEVRARKRAPAAAPTVSSEVPGPDGVRSRGAALVERALSYLQRHYREPNLCLRAASDALGCNPNYLTTRFTQLVGEHMRAHLIGLRVAHACRLLVDTDSSIKKVAFASGFVGASRLANAFRARVGVSPSEYRRVFAPVTSLVVPRETGAPVIVSKPVRRSRG